MSDLAETAGGEGTALEATEGLDTQESQSRDYEAEARSQGWRPKDEFKGDPSHWTDAEAFVRRADEVLPLIKKQNASLKREIDDLKKMVRKVTASERAAHANALAELEARREEAVETGDVSEFRAIDKKLSALREDVTGGTPGLTHGEDPEEVFGTFREENKWYDKAALASATEMEIEARWFADRLSDKYARQGLQHEMAPSAFFAKIAAEVDAKFPTLKMKAARPKPASDVAGVTRPGLGGKAKVGANLPADAKAQATRFFDQGIIKGKSLSEALDNYAKNFDWSAS